MAILQIKSGNQDLSFVIQKNPANPLTVKNNKNGVLFGYFPNVNGILQTNQYIIYFVDASDSVSYKVHENEQFEYLTASKYNNARFINDAIQEMLHSAREGKGDSLQYDSVTEQEITINVVETQYKTIDIFRRHFTEIEILHEEISINNYRLSFKSVSTLNYLLKIVNLFSMFAALNSDDFIYVEDSICGKYVRLIEEVDAPYFIRYLMKVRMLREGKRFDMFKEQLESSKAHNISMQRGDTHVMRIDWIKNQLLNKIESIENNTRKTSLELKEDLPIIDIGTGIDFRYLKIFAPILQEKGLTYYAIERDPDAIARINAGLKNRNLEDTVELFDSIESFLEYKKEYLSNQKFNIICTEVLEHNEFEEAKTIVKNICKNINYDKFIITVPNKEFNQFYGIADNQFRHDDHKWEANINDISEIANLHNTCKTIALIGDTVDNISVTYGLILSNEYNDKF